MERLTKRINGNAVIEFGPNADGWCIGKNQEDAYHITGDAIDRLAAYEDTGLTPEEVAELKTPCDLCVYNPPSSRDGKACSMCPAMGKGGAE